MEARFFFPNLRMRHFWIFQPACKQAPVDSPQTLVSLCFLPLSVSCRSFAEIKYKGSFMTSTFTSPAVLKSTNTFVKCELDGHSCSPRYTFAKKSKVLHVCSSKCTQAVKCDSAEVLRVISFVPVYGQMGKKRLYLDVKEITLRTMKIMVIYDLRCTNKRNLKSSKESLSSK